MHITIIIMAEKPSDLMHIIGMRSQEAALYFLSVLLKSISSPMTPNVTNGIQSLAMKRERNAGSVSAPMDMVQLSQSEKMAFSLVSLRCGIICYTIVDCV